MTGTPKVSSTSKVFETSKIAFAPAATTVTAVCANSCKSAEISKLSSAPRCTPPMPPVAKTEMPAKFAAIIVAATVVAPVPPVAKHTAISARLSFAAPLVCASVSNCALSKPTNRVPSITAIVAGSAPAARTVASTLSAISRFCG